MAEDVISELENPCFSEIAAVYMTLSAEDQEAVISLLQFLLQPE